MPYVYPLPSLVQTVSNDIPHCRWYIPVDIGMQRPTAHGGWDRRGKQQRPPPPASGLWSVYMCMCASHVACLCSVWLAELEEKRFAPGGGGSLEPLFQPPPPPLTPHVTGTPRRGDGGRWRGGGTPTYVTQNDPPRCADLCEGCVMGDMCFEKKLRSPLCGAGGESSSEVLHSPLWTSLSREPL